MRRLFLAAALIALLAAAPGASAQDATASEAPAETAAPASTADAAGDPGSTPCRPACFASS